MSATEITSIVGGIMGVTPSDLRQLNRRDRSDRVVLARCAAISLCRKHTTVSSTALARFYNLQNHATVLNAVKTCNGLIDTNRVFATLYSVMERAVSQSEFDRLQLTDFIPFVYTPQNIANE